MPQPEEARLMAPKYRAGRANRLSVRVGLRPLMSSRQIEGEIRKRPRARFGSSLPRFDLLAQPPHDRRVGHLATPFAVGTAGVPATRRKAAR